MLDQPGPLSELAKEIFKSVKAKGFYDEPRTFGDICALYTTEVAEAYEATRIPGKDEQSVWYEVKNDFATGKDPFLNIYDRVFLKGETVDHETYLKLIEDDPTLVADLKPEGAPYEQADIIIRVLDTLGFHDISPDELVARKMAYNATRAYKHGKTI